MLCCVMCVRVRGGVFESMFNCVNVCVGEWEGGEWEKGDTSMCVSGLASCF